jgi:AcrR family transcriptional regulator
VETAQALIRERGDAGFSMAQLASAAGVSAATPYNLLGSKAGILRLVVAEDFQRFTARLGDAGGGSALARLLHAADRVVGHYEADRPFHRGLLRAAFSADAAEVRDMMSLEGRSLWRGLVEAAVASGELAATVRPGPLAAVLIRAIGAAAQTWLAEGWAGDRFALDMSLSVRLVLASVAVARREALATEIADAQAAIAVLTGDPPPPPAAPPLATVDAVTGRSAPTR